MTNQEKIQKLAELREKALKYIEEYNDLAEKENYHVRIGVIDAEFNLESKFGEGEQRPKNITNYIDDNYGEDTKPYYIVNSPGTKNFWFPSNMNCT